MRALILVLLGGAMAASQGSARVADPPANAADSQEPRSGLICAWAMLRTSVEVGRRCRVGTHPGLQETLEHSVARLEEHARQRSPEVWPQMQDYFRRRIAGKTDAQLCAAEPVNFYSEMATGEPEALRDETDRVISLPGPVEWGDCV